MMHASLRFWGLAVDDTSQEEEEEGQRTWLVDMFSRCNCTVVCIGAAAVVAEG